MISTLATVLSLGVTVDLGLHAVALQGPDPEHLVLR